MKHYRRPSIEEVGEITSLWSDEGRGFDFSFGEVRISQVELGGRLRWAWGHLCHQNTGSSQFGAGKTETRAQST